MGILPRKDAHIEAASLSSDSQEEAFRMAMQARELIPPHVLLADGRIHRCATQKHPDRQDGSYLMANGNRPHGGFQNWGDEKGWEHWVLDGGSTSTEEDRAAESKLAEARKAEQAICQAAAADRAEQIWNEASPCEEHPYLASKSVRSYGLRTWKDMLVIPLKCPEGKISSLQMIAEDGTKRFLKGGRKKGCSFLIGDAGTGTLCVAEGYATAATIHQATGFACAVAFDCQNLAPVASSLKAAWPAREILVCGDDDLSIGNPGATNAERAAREIDGRYVLPWWLTSRRDHGESDFNDLAKGTSLQVVKANIQAGLGGWGEPQPLFMAHEELPYPLDALPPMIRGAVEEVLGFVQAPEALIASSALGALSLAAQQHYDVKRAEGLSGPTGLFFLSIADSGERKSSCDGHFTKCIHAYEAEQASLGKAAVAKANDELEVWTAKCDGLKEAIRKGAQRGQDTDNEETLLRNLVETKPLRPRIPKLLYLEFTPEALLFRLAKEWPSGGVLSSEAGLVFGSHGMNSESVMRNLSSLNQLWDGSDISIARKTSESFVLRGARLTMALQIQESTLKAFMDRTGALARGTGFLARFLVAWPVSKIGHRPFREPSCWQSLEAFQRRLRELLELPAAVDENGGLTPSMLTLSPEAKAIWIAFHDRIEEQMGISGDYATIKDVASKSADNVARLAALFYALDGVGGEYISAEYLKAACRIVEWHLNESRRFFNHMVIPCKLAQAKLLEDWLVHRMRATGKDHIPTSEVLQYGPPSLRVKADFEATAQELAQMSRIRIFNEGKRRFIAVNPMLLV